MVAPLHLLFIRTLLTHSFLLCVSSSLVLPKCLLNHSHRNCNGRFGAPQTKLGSSVDVSEATTATTVLDHDEHYHVRAPPNMVPLSQPPLLLLQSSTPIISKEGCSLLSQYFDHLTNNNGGSGDAYQFDKTKMHMAQKLLCSIHDVIDKVTNCPRHDKEKQIPRYVRYDSTLIDGEERSSILDSKGLGDTLLPDGLHVDTNNGKLFRHISAILYLTDNQDGFSMDCRGDRRSNDNGTMLKDDIFVAGGGTTFPVAIPIGEKRMQECTNNVQDAAKSLLERDLQHTKGDVDENAASDGRILEKACLDAFHRDVAKDLNDRYRDCFSEAQPTVGVRVMPEAGKLIYFHNVDDGGMPDPNSFHGGEELISILAKQQQHDDINNMAGHQKSVSKTKTILVFFKEIPYTAFIDRDGFAELAEKSRSWTKEMYY